MTIIVSAFALGFLAWGMLRREERLTRASLAALVAVPVAAAIALAVQLAQEAGPDSVAVLARRFGLAYEYSNFFFHAALMNAFGGGVFAAIAPDSEEPAGKGAAS